MIDNCSAHSNLLAIICVTNNFLVSLKKDTKYKCRYVFILISDVIGNFLVVQNYIKNKIHTYNDLNTSSLFLIFKIKIH